MNIFKTVRESTKNFKNLRNVSMMALLVALYVVFSLFSIQISSSDRVSFTFIASSVTGFIFGPVPGFVCGILFDVISFIVKPTGSFFPGWTLNAALGCMIYGLFLYRKLPDLSKPFDFKYLIRVLLAMICVAVFVNMLLGTLWVHIMYGKAFWAYLTTRAIRNLIQIPINTVVSYFILAGLAHAGILRFVDDKYSE